MTESNSNPSFGVRIIANLLAYLKPVFLCAVLSGGLGFVYGVNAPKMYLYEGTIGVGLLYPKEAIESPMAVVKQFTSSALSLVNYDSQRGIVNVSVTPGSHRRNVGPILNVRIFARTASMAVSMFDRASTDLLERHKRAYRYEQELNSEHSRSAQGRAEVLREIVNAENSLLNDTSVGLFSARTDGSSAKALALHFQAPPTSILRRDIEPTPVLAKWLKFTVAGTGSGLLMGLIFVLILVLVKESKDPDDQRSLSRILVFFGKYRNLVLGTGLITMLLGLGFAITKSAKVTASTTLQMSYVAPFGPFTDLDAMKIGLQDHIDHEEERLCKNECSLDADIIAIRAALTPYSSTTIVEVRVTGKEKQKVRKVLDSASGYFLKRQEASFVSAIEIHKAKVEQLKLDVQRMAEAEAQRIDQEVMIGFIREITKHRRYLNPARSYPARILLPVSFLPSKLMQSSFLFALLGLIFGLLGGSALAFLHESWRYSRTQ